MRSRLAGSATLVTSDVPTGSRIGRNQCHGSIRWHHEIDETSNSGEVTMAEQFDKRVEILDGAGDITITLDATKADATLGGNGRGGDVRLYSSADTSLTEDLAKIALD